MAVRVGAPSNFLLPDADPTPILGHMNTVETFEVSAGVPPLADRTVVVTRPKAQAEELAEALERLGARVVRIPSIRIEHIADSASLEKAVRGETVHDWVIFTSANGVRSFQAAADEAGLDVRDCVREASVCCIGPATARAAEAVGLSVDLVPETHVAEGALDALAARGSLDGLRILLPVADGARDVLPAGLRGRGAIVDVVTTHRTVAVDEAPPDLLAQVEMGVDLLTFTSPSSVRCFHRLVEGRPPAPAAVIGPVTAAAARELGYEVAVEAREFTVAGLVEAIVTHYAGGPS